MVTHLVINPFIVYVSHSLHLLFITVVIKVKFQLACANTAPITHSHCAELDEQRIVNIVTRAVKNGFFPGNEGDISCESRGL